MGKKLPYYKMYPNDFDADERVRLLDCREAGLYLFALNHSWNNDGLPGDDLEVGKMLKVPIRDFRAAWPAVRKCFALCEDGRLRNSRQEEERAAAFTKSQKASESADSRWSEGNAKRMRTHTERNAPTNTNASLRAYESESEYESVVETSKNQKPSTQEISSLGRFAEWWEVWSAVRGTNHKPRAVQAWISVVRQEIESACIECTVSYLESLEKPAKGYNPENFLFEQVKQNFEARWPKARDSPTADRNQKRRDETLALAQYMRGTNDTTKSM